MSRREIILRDELSTVFPNIGFNVFLPVFDDGIDMIVHCPGAGRPDTVHLVQQKSRWTIARKYVGRGISIAFPDAARWYLIDHDAMLDWPEVAGYLEIASWRDAGLYSRAALSRALAVRCAPFALGSRPVA